mgnify:CR=1 FL=1
MKINRVTFTGPDIHTDVNELKVIQNDYPFVEWGILISGNPNIKRHPPKEFIESLKDTGLNLSLHLCAKYSSDIMKKGIIEIPYEFFSRYQINFNFKFSKHNIEYYEQLTNKYKNKDFILQYNRSNEPYVKDIIHKYNMSNTNILFDASGGRGTEISSIEKPFFSIYTGYSGGIYPDNVIDICNKINDYKNYDNVWIDMESGVRTDDIFDLGKVRDVLKKVEKFI